MVEGQFGSEALKKYNSSLKVLNGEMEAFKEAHEMATATGVPQPVVVDGQAYTIKDDKNSRVVVIKNG